MVVVPISTATPSAEPFSRRTSMMVSSRTTAPYTVPGSRQASLGRQAASTALRPVCSKI